MEQLDCRTAARIDGDRARYRVVGGECRRDKRTLGSVTTYSKLQQTKVFEKRRLGLAHTAGPITNPGD
jgi:hypothetical protein